MSPPLVKLIFSIHAAASDSNDGRRESFLRAAPVTSGAAEEWNSELSDVG
jgi:hypothetical protein